MLYVEDFFVLYDTKNVVFLQLLSIYPSIYHLSNQYH